MTTCIVNEPNFSRPKTIDIMWNMIDFDNASILHVLVIIASIYIFQIMSWRKMKINHVFVSLLGKIAVLPVS